MFPPACTTLPAIPVLAQRVRLGSVVGGRPILRTDLPALPSLAEWKAAQVEADVQYWVKAGGLSREAAVAEVKPDDGVF